MVTIQVDDKTAEFLESQARSVGLSVGEYLRTLVPAPLAGARPAWDEIEGQFLSLSTPASSLPANFSRADIYEDHD